MMAFHFPTDFTRALRHLATYQESQPQHLELIRYLAAEGGSVPLAELDRLRGQAPGCDPGAALDHLRECGLVLLRAALGPDGEPEGEPAVAMLADSLEPLFRLPGFYRNRLRRKIGGRDLDELRRMAAGFYAGSPTPVAEDCADRALLLAAFKAMLLDAGGMRAALDEHVSWTGRVILKSLSMHPEGLPLKDLRKQVGLFGIKLDSDELKRELVQLFRATGLVWTSDGSTLLKSDQYVPAEARILLVTDAVAMIRSNCQLEEAPPQLVPVFAGRLEPEAWKVRHEPVQIFQNALILLVHLVNHRVQRIQKGGVHKTEVKRVCALFQPPQEDSNLFDYLFQHFQDRGIIQTKHEVYAVHVPAAAEFFRKPGESLRALMAEAFGVDILAKGRLEDKLERAEAGQLDPARLLWLLKHVSPSAWISQEELTYLLGQLDGGLRTEAQRNAAERFTTHQLVKPLFWLGLVELSNHPESGGLVFRLSARGRRVLLENLPPDDLDGWFDPAEKLLVQANLEVFLPTRFLPEHTLYLARFADYEKGRFRVSKTSLSRGLDSGLSLDHIQGFLAEHSSQAIPQNVSYLLEEVTNRHGHILVDPQLMVLKTETPLLMQELALAPGLRKSWLGLLDGQLMLLHPTARVQRLVEELRRLGYMPRVRWEAVIDEGGEQLELSQGERLRMLALLKAWEFAEKVHPELGELLKLVSEQLADEDRAEMGLIPQRKLGDSYAKLDALSAALAAGRLQ